MPQIAAPNAAYTSLTEQLASNSKARGQAFNFSNEIQVTVLEMVNRILAAICSTLVPEIRSEATNEIGHQYLDATKARKLLGWHPIFSFDEGVRMTIEWYKNHLRAS